MLKHYFKTAWRNLRKNRFYASVNILGLAISFASFIVMLVYFNYQMSYDKWNDALKKVYKVSLKENNDVMRTTQAALAPFLQQHDPNVDVATAFQPADDFEVLISSGNKKIYQKGSVIADSLFFQVFPYKFIKGNPATALNAPDAIVLTEEVARKLFGNADAMGKTIRVYNMIDYVVTGIIQLPDEPTNLNIGFVAHDRFRQMNSNPWQNYSYQTYVKLKHPENQMQLDNELNKIFFDYHLKTGNQTFQAYQKQAGQSSLFTDALQQIHNFPKYGQSNFRITLVLLILAVFLLITGAINFSNLSIARAFTRAKEVGVRKVLGSKRIYIVLQSLLEVGLQCIAALLAGLLLASIALIYFSHAFNISLSFLDAKHIFLIALQILACLVFIVLFAGLYPALFLSKFEATEVLRGAVSRGKRGLFFRNCLLVVQLTLSTFFIIGSLVIVKQLHFMQTKNLGFDPSQVVRIDAIQSTREEKFEATRLKLLEIPGVEYVSKTTLVPGDKYIDTSRTEFSFEAEKHKLNSVRISNDYFKTLSIPALQGRVFDYAHPEDTVYTAIINEAALKELHVDNAVGMLIRNSYIKYDSLPYTIVGVVKDFNVQGVQHAIIPTIYTISNHRTDYRSGGAILIKINTADVQRTIEEITKLWKNVEPEFPVRYSFLDQNFQKLYTSEAQLAKIILFFTVISIIIAAIGLFALTAFLAEQRTKEIGIRKVFGASVKDIALLLSKDFMLLTVVALIIAAPLAWMATANWLNGFTYRIHPDWGLFLLAGIIAFIVSIATVIFQSLKAARANPVKSLKTE